MLNKNKNIHLQNLIEAGHSYLVENNYSLDTITRYKKIWSNLSDYALSRNIDFLTEDIKIDFLKDKYGSLENRKPKEYNKKLRAIQVLSDIQDNKPIQKMKKSRNYEPPQIFKDIFNQYFNFLDQNITSWESIRNHKALIINFLEYLDCKGLEIISNLNTQIILNYLKRKSRLANSTKSKVFSELRLFLKYLYNQRLTLEDLSIFVPAIPYNKKSKIPSAFSKEEILDIISVIDRSTSIGKRDYSIILLASMLGIRSSDICNMSFKNINWITNEIKFTQVKTGNIIKLPLKEDIGEAIIDYLKNGRPNSSIPYIFIRHYAPYDRLTNGATYDLLNKYINKANIEIPNGKHHGLHALRHSLASELLRQNITLPVISEISGHSNTEITSVYLKIDIKQLQKCALEVPLCL